jgi:hypothetical protein
LAASITWISLPKILEKQICDRILQGALVQLGSLLPKRLRVKGRDLLLGKRQFLSAHSGSSSKTGKVFGWSGYDAEVPLGLASPISQKGRQHGVSSSSTALVS